MRVYDLRCAPRSRRALRLQVPHRRRLALKRSLPVHVTVRLAAGCGEAAEDWTLFGVAVKVLCEGFMEPLHK
jgi:hypothetical protein